MAVDEIEVWRHMAQRRIPLGHLVEQVEGSGQVAALVSCECLVVQGLGCFEVLPEACQELLGIGSIRLGGIDVTEGQLGHAPGIEGAALPQGVAQSM